MVGGVAEALVWGVALAALVLVPLASWLIAGVGREISADIDGGGAGEPADDLRAEVRSMVLATNERRRRAGKPPLEVEAEVERRLRDAGA